MKLILRLEKAVENLSSYPEIGSFVENEFVVDKSIRKYIVHKLYSFL